MGLMIPYRILETGCKHNKNKFLSIFYCQLVSLGNYWPLSGQIERLRFVAGECCGEFFPFGCLNYLFPRNLEIFYDLFLRWNQYVVQ